ncbi:MAG TPA: ABC transporter ATP-binding protein [Acidobacteriota bacterium]|nr:ABC transporter ATP-binding protein [Acidobacteriota bacterium]
MSPLLQVDGLSKSYDGHPAVSRVSFAVEAGQSVALLGPNGSGKTTILRCVAGLLGLDAGRVEIDGLRQSRRNRRVRRLFSYLPQQASFAPALTPLEIVSFHARLRGLDQQACLPALEDAGILRRDQQRRVAELSQGMRQRLSLAVAGLGQAPLMLFDEPTASLDVEAALHMRELAIRWRQQGRALLFSTHVLDDVEALADQAVILVEGRVVARRNVAELRAELSRRSLLRVRMSRPDRRLAQAAKEAGALDVSLNSHSLLITASPQHRYAILSKLAEVGEVESFQTEEPSIEQVYMGFVRGRTEQEGDDA